MNNKFNQLMDIVSETKKVVYGYQDNMGIIYDKLKKESRNDRLTVTLYGAYNAGKSTLVNCILGHEVAKVADKPTTDRIDQYEWKDIIFADTPGVNAPLEHELATMKQLKGSSAILFVIRENDWDSKNVYSRLIDQIKEKKKIFIVLNHQLSDVTQKEIACNYVEKKLTEMAISNNLDIEDFKDISILPINLKTAFSAKQRNIPQLLQHSGFIEFENVFNRWLTQQNELKNKFDQFKLMINRLWFEPTLTAIDLKLNNDVKDLISQKRKNIDLIELSKQNTLNDSRIYIKNLIAQNEYKIAEIFEKLGQGANSSEAERGLSNLIQNMLSQLSEYFEIELNAKSNSIKELNLHDYEVKKSRGNENLEGVNHSEGDNSSKAGIGDVLASTTANMQVAKVTAKEVSKYFSPKILGKIGLPSTLISSLGTIGKFISTAAPWVALAGGLFSLFGLSKDDSQRDEYERHLRAQQLAEQENNEKVKQAQMKILQLMEEFKANIFEDFSSRVKVAINDIFDTKKRVIDNEITGLVENNQKIHSDMTVIQNAQTQLMSEQW